MNLADFVQLQYCYNYLIDQIPVQLLLYSHIPTAIAAVLFGAYVFVQVRKLPSFTLFIVCLAFALWCAFDLISWFAFLGAGEMMFAWSLLDLLALIFFSFGYYFLYTFLTGKDLPLWQKLVGILIILPTAVTTALGLNLTSFDANTCEAIEDDAIALYPYFVQGFILLSTIALTVYLYLKAKTKELRGEILLAGIGMSLFMAFFLSATLGVNYLVNDTAVEFAYNFEIYGLFGMPVLLIYLGYLIVRYRAFDLKIFGAQALVLALLVVIASEFAFITSFTNRILISITLVLTAIAGVILVRSVRKEIEQREHIEKLAAELEVANKQQVALIHFITHQIKGFLTKSRGIFASMIEGDFGVIPDTLKPMAEEGLRSGTEGVNTVQEILNASNIKTGKVSYAMAPVDLKALIQGIFDGLKPNAEAKSLDYTFTADEGAFTINADQAQLTNAFKNLIDNTIKYTPKGSVKVSLTHAPGKIVFRTEDTGVGITPEDMAHLFTEGGHGKDSQKVNTDSTGFGLYIVKNIIEAHKGKVWAESDGAGKGSRFFVELPA